jgi:hypothetical protein
MNLLEHISMVRILVLLTFLFVMYRYNRNVRTQKLLFLLILLSTVFEVLSAVLKSANIPRQLPATIFVCIHTLLWLALLSTVSPRKRIIAYVAAIYVLLTTMNFLFLDVQDIFRYTFVFGALLYLIIFIYDSFMELSIENLNYFTSYNYFIIAAPVLYFIGFSLIFAFKERNIGQVQITSFITLYDFTSYLVNLIYYTLVNVYIYRANKQKPWNTI